MAKRKVYNCVRYGKHRFNKQKSARYCKECALIVRKEYNKRYYKIWRVIKE